MRAVLFIAAGWLLLLTASKAPEARAETRESTRLAPRLQTRPLPDAAPTAEDHSRPQTIQLDNGLRVILQATPGAPLTAVRVTIASGAASDPKRRPGLAHLTEHMAFGPTRHIGTHLLLQSLDMGAQELNGSTSNDRIEYYFTIPANRLEQALRLESDRLGFLLGETDKTLLRKEQRIVEREIAMRTGSDRYFWEHRREFLFPKSHPYHRAGTLTARPKRASLNDVRAFFQGTHRPDNAVLTLVGGFQPRRAKALVQKYFGPLKNPDVPIISADLPNVEPPKDTTRLFLYRGRHTIVGLDWLLPRFDDLKTWLIHRMIMIRLDEVMERDLREERRVANHLWTGVDLDFGPSRLHVTVYAPARVAHDQLYPMMLTAAKKSFGQVQQIYDKKRTLELESRILAQSVQSRASTYATHLLAFGRVYSTEEQISILAAITPEDIRKALQSESLHLDRARGSAFIPGGKNPEGVRVK